MVNPIGSIPVSSETPELNTDSAAQVVSFVDRKSLIVVLADELWELKGQELGILRQQCQKTCARADCGLSQRFTVPFGSRSASQPADLFFQQR